MLSKTVYKYYLNWGETVVTVSPGSQFLAFGTEPAARLATNQDSKLVMWIETAPLEPGSPVIEKSFTFIGTGHEVPRYHQYKGTTRQGDFVWHLYEKIA